MRDLIMSAVEDRLKGILVVNGYTTDLGDNVFSWQLTPLPDGSLPAATFRDPSREIVQHVAGHLNKLTVEIEVIPSSSMVPAIDWIRLFIKEVVRAIGTDISWGGHAIDTVVTGDVVQLDATGTAIKSGLINVVITYRGGEFSE